MTETRNPTTAALAFKVVIPARHASTRLPGKPLLEIAGRPMIQHVWERARSSGAGEVIVATDDARIAGACRDFFDEASARRGLIHGLISFCEFLLPKPVE